MQNRSHFHRGSAVYNCGTCGRGTRATGVQAVGSELCPQCWDIAGIDNQINDDGRSGPNEGEASEVSALLKQIVSKGGNEQAVRDCNGYAFGAASPTVSN